MNKHQRTYWIFQTAGWSLYCLIYIFFYLSIRPSPQPHFFEQLLTHVFIGFWLTHIMRMVIQRLGILKLSLQKQIFSLTILSLAFSFCIGVSIVATESWMDIQSFDLTSFSFLDIAIRFAFSYFHFVLIWNLLYFVYHFVQKTREQNIEQAKLENLLSELEITTLKSHINPEFLFNSLNGIRSLVTDDPVRARKAITMLSNILRNSIQVDKAEKTLFEKELSIIKDYIALEQIRFADQLFVQYDIEEDTLDQPVPAMVMQYLVEKAIRHGFDEQIKTGSIHVYSEYKEDLHCFGVISSGNFSNYLEQENDHLSEIRKRIYGIYGQKARILVDAPEVGMIKAAVCIPL